MSEKSIEELVGETAEAAVAVYEDFQHLRLVTEQAETKPTDLRHASAILRRWLVEGQVRRVASPRIGRINLLAIDNNPVYRAERKGGIKSFVSGGASIHGIYIACGMKSEGGRPVALQDYHPDNLIELSLDTFLKQRVILTGDRWITRLQVIKFVANVDHGVHGGAVKDDVEADLASFRQQIAVTLTTNSDGLKMPSLAWSEKERADDTLPKNYDPAEVNGVLLELLATMHFLITSPDIIRLIEVIKADL